MAKPTSSWFVLGGVDVEKMFGHRWKRSSIAIVAVCATASLGLGVAPVSAATTHRGVGDHLQAVIVRAVPGGQPHVRSRITEVGGRVDRNLSIIDGFAAHVPRSSIGSLRHDQAVLSVSPDRGMRPMTFQSSLGYDTADTGSMSSISTMVGAQRQWAAGYTGAGIGVALIDTGVTRVGGLSTTGKVIDGPDISFDSQSPALAHLDSFGHGTHMAGIIAGRDTTATSSATGCAACLNSSGYSDESKFVGIAPDAKIINVKVGATDGATDVSQVIAAIDWVVQHKDDAGLNIKVLNLSFGTNVTQAYGVDPLAFAVEVAWNNGIVVVAAGGNDGLTVPSLANPAYSPRIIAVGANDPLGTATKTDDVIPDFATHGTEQRGVDVVAPGTSVMSLRVPGSYVDTYYPGGTVGTRFQRASGTSQSTAVVSGIVALLRQRFPLANPEQIKALLKLGAFRLNANLFHSGTGIADANGSALLGASSTIYNGLPTVSKAAPSSGAGTIEGSRGDSHVIDGKVELRGEKDIFNKTFTSSTMAKAETNRSSWNGGTWNGSVWTGTGNATTGWSVVAWTGTNWAGNLWSGSRWKNMSWDGSRWKGNGWSGSRWRNATWTDATWSGSRWR